MLRKKCMNGSYAGIAQSSGQEPCYQPSVFPCKHKGEWALGIDERDHPTGECSALCRISYERDAGSGVTV